MKASKDEKQFCLYTAGLFVIFLFIYAAVYKPEYERETEAFAKAVRAHDVQKAASMILYSENDDSRLKMFFEDACKGYEILKADKMSNLYKRKTEQKVFEDFGRTPHIQRGYYLDILIEKENSLERIKTALVRIGGRWYFTNCIFDGKM